MHNYSNKLILTKEPRMTNAEMTIAIEDIVDASNCRDVEWLTNYIFHRQTTFTREECRTNVRVALSCM